ncbi:MAG: L-dopachrome tautomerase-related protein [Anaeromyxobacter sp.]
MNRFVLLAALLALAAPSPSRAATAGNVEYEIVAEWNSLPYDVPSAEGQAYKKALMQGVKVDSKGNVYVSTARWGGPEVPATLSKVVEKNGKKLLQPFPSLAMNDPNNPEALQAVLGFEIDRNDVMWILDQGHVAGAPSKPGAEKLILWDLKANKELQRYVFTDKDSDKKCSFLNDVAVDNDTGFAYIADSGIFCDPLDGGLIVYDSKANKARRILDRTVFTNDQAGFVFRIDNRPVLEKNAMRTGADGIALSGDKKTLYWTTLTGNVLYSLPTALLRDPKASEADLRMAVTKVTTLLSNTDGMTADRDGNVIATALMLNGLQTRDAKTGQVRTLFIHPEMSWPDTLSWGPDGSLYVASNHLHLWVDGAMDFDDPPVPNFRIWKLKLNRRPYTAK